MEDHRVNKLSSIIELLEEKQSICIQKVGLLQKETMDIDASGVTKSLEQLDLFDRFADERIRLLNLQEDISVKKQLLQRYTQRVSAQKDGASSKLKFVKENIDDLLKEADELIKSKSLKEKDKAKLKRVRASFRDSFKDNELVSFYTGLSDLIDNLEL